MDEELSVSEIERVTVALPTPMADRLRSAVKSGEYATTSEIVRDALRLWEGRRELRGRELAALKAAWDQGKASGPARPLDIEAIVGKARRAKKSGRG